MEVVLCAGRTNTLSKFWELSSFCLMEKKRKFHQAFGNSSMRLRLLIQFN